jgi:hypothetical protein
MGPASPATASTTPERRMSIKRRSSLGKARGRVKRVVKRRGPMSAALRDDTFRKVEVGLVHPSYFSRCQIDQTPHDPNQDRRPAERQHHA